MKKEKSVGAKIFAFCVLHVKKHLELIIWISALSYLAFFVNPNLPNFSFCVFKLLGIDSCWGCGLGRSIAYLFDGDWSQSFKTHMLGFFATFILFYRILELTYPLIFTKNKS